MSLKDVKGGKIRLVEHALFDVFIGICIIANTVVVGIEVDRDLGTAGFIMQVLFAAVWVLEATLKIWTWGLKGYFSKKSNIFDFLLCLAAILDVVRLSAAGLHGVTVLKVLIITRILRMLRVFMIFGPLRLLLAGLLKSAAALFWVLVMMSLVLYTFAVFFTHLVKDECDNVYRGWDECEDHYGSLEKSLISLWQLMFDPADMRPLVINNLIMVFPVILFLMLTFFGLMNIIIGVLVQETLEHAQNQQELLAEEKLLQQRKELECFWDLAECADSDSDNKISREEFQEMCTREDVRKLFEGLDLPVDRPRIAARLFEVLDAEGDGKLDRQYFVDRITSLKREGRLSVKDQSMLLTDVRHLDRRLTKLEKQSAESIAEIPQKVFALLVENGCVLATQTL